MHFAYYFPSFPLSFSIVTFMGCGMFFFLFRWSIEIPEIHWLQSELMNRNSVISEKLWTVQPSVFGDRCSVSNVWFNFKGSLKIIIFTFQYTSKKCVHTIDEWWLMAYIIWYSVSCHIWNGLLFEYIYFGSLAHNQLYSCYEIRSLTIVCLLFSFFIIIHYFGSNFNGRSNIKMHARLKWTVVVWFIWLLFTAVYLLHFVTYNNSNPFSKIQISFRMLWCVLYD